MTGGTAWWFHTEGTKHVPVEMGGGYTVDLRLNSALAEFIETNQQISEEQTVCPDWSDGTEGYYIYGNFTGPSAGQTPYAGCYYRESNHWHVEFFK